MAATKRSSSRTRKTSNKIRADWPTWYYPDAPLGSAVRYLAALSPKFHWVGIYIKKGEELELGPYIGAATRFEKGSEWVVLIRDKTDKVVGQIDIDSHVENAFGPDEETTAQRVARVLGELWPE